MALAGAIVGQLGFGAIADLIGRRSVFIMTCTIVITGSILSATVVDSASFGLYAQLSLWRFLLGVGVGGEYPLSAAVTAESSESGSEIRNLSMVCVVLFSLLLSVLDLNDFDIVLKNFAIRNCLNYALFISGYVVIFLNNS
jgi:MFS family permease